MLLGRELSTEFKLCITSHFHNHNTTISTGYKQNTLRIWQKIAELAGGYKSFKANIIFATLVLMFLIFSVVPMVYIVAEIAPLDPQHRIPHYCG